VLSLFGYGSAMAEGGGDAVFPWSYSHQVHSFKTPIGRSVH